jgi:hypothetical protein
MVMISWIALSSQPWSSAWSAMPRISFAGHSGAATTSSEPRPANTSDNQHKTREHNDLQLEYQRVGQPIRRMASSIRFQKPSKSSFVATSAFGSCPRRLSKSTEVMPLVVVPCVSTVT